jgi:hypothetical protein
MLAEKEGGQSKTALGQSIRVQQVENLKKIKDRLENNVNTITLRTPYVDVKVAVEKLF